MFGLQPVHILISLVCVASILSFLVFGSAMKGQTAWGILSWVIGLLASLLFSPAYATRLGWPGILVFIVIFLDVALVLYSPITIRDYLAAFRLNEMLTSMEQNQPSVPWTNLGTSTGGLLLLTLIFIVAPIAVLIWLISLL